MAYGRVERLSSQIKELKDDEEILRQIRYRLRYRLECVKKGKDDPGKFVELPAKWVWEDDCD